MVSGTVCPLNPDTSDRTLKRTSSVVGYYLLCCVSRALVSRAAVGLAHALRDCGRRPREMDLILLIENQNGNIAPIAVDVFEIDGDVRIKLPVRLALDINRFIASHRDYELGLRMTNQFLA